MRTLPQQQLLTPIEHGALLEFVKTQDCPDETHSSVAAADGTCIDCLTADYIDKFGLRPSDVKYATYQTCIEVEVEWLIERIRQLSQIRHGDPYYYFGHERAQRPPRESSPDYRRQLSPSTRRRILERDAYRCMYCDSWDKLAIDHVVPVSRGGTDDDDNLQTLCRTCNTSKGKKTMEEWLRWKEAQ